MIDPLKALALHYQERGDHAFAIAAIERAVALVRVNYGLHSLQQAPLIRQRILSEDARGNFAAAWDLEKELRSLAGRHPGDLRTADIFREIGDKRMDILGRYVDGEFPPQITLGCYYNGTRDESEAPGVVFGGRLFGDCESGSRSVVVQSILSDAWTNYTDAIKVLLRNELYSSDELKDLEMELVRSRYEHRDHLLSSAHEDGRRILRRLMGYAAVGARPLSERVDALLQLADWDLLFSSNGTALEAYRQAYEQLEEGDAPRASIEQVFAPEVPIVLPAFEPNPLISDSAPETRGHIDVAFDITRYGIGQDIEILDTTANATDADRKQLVRLISQSRFRPRATAGGRFPRRSSVVLRYYLND